MELLRLTLVRITCAAGLTLFTAWPAPVVAQEVAKPLPETAKATETHSPYSAALMTGLSSDALELCLRLKLDAKQIEELLRKPLYEFKEAEVDVYLRFLHEAQPDLRRRVMELARKNIGQPYEIYLLGEMPFEHYDPQPIYCLSKSDCLVFAEHAYAMALGHDWPSFMRWLQRIRYREGRISVVTRNHFTEADWNRSNQWLVRDVTREMAADHGIAFRQKIDRAGFLKKRYQLEVDIPVEDFQDVYIPFFAVKDIESKLENGDFVNVVRGFPKATDESSATFGGSAWVGHVGIILRDPDGTVNMIHSAKPSVREEPLQDYIAAAKTTMAERDEAGKARLLGFKFLRLREDPLASLREVDGAAAPQIHLPRANPSR